MNVETFTANVQLPFAMVVASKRNSGKTMLVSQFIKALLHQKKIFAPVIYSNTAHLNGDYSFLPAGLVRKFNPENLKELMEKQSAIPKNKRPALLLVLDDVLGDERALGNKEILYAYAMGRHINIHPILISQTANRVLTPPIRNNADYFVLSRLNRQQLGEVWESITNMEKREFIQFVEEVNKHFTFVVVDNTGHSNEPEKFLKLIRASPEKSVSTTIKDASDSSDAEE
jgi:hypothetical protein